MSKNASLPMSYRHFLSIRFSEFGYCVLIGLPDEGNDMMVMKSRFASFRPSGWSPYDYPESERDNVNFEGWKKDEEVPKTTRTNQSGVAGLESLFSQSHKT